MGKPKKMDYGEKIEYDPTFDGPIKNRSCTDIICLFIFFAFILAWGVLGIWALKNGDPSNIISNKMYADSSGLRCGIDPTVKNLPYLFYFDVTECRGSSVPYFGCLTTTKVCVSRCPNTTFYHSDEISKEIAIPYCTYEQRKKKTYNETNCPKWFVPTKEVLNRCLPSLTTLNNKTLTEIENSIKRPSLDSSLWRSINTGTSNIKSSADNDEGLKNIMEDVLNSWERILSGVILALVSSMIYILMLRWFAGFMVWFSIFVSVAAWTAVTVYFCILWQRTKERENNDGNFFLALFVIFAICLAIAIVVLIFLRSKIKLAIVLIKEGSKAIASATSVLFFPILPWTLQIGVTAYAVFVWVYLYSTNTISSSQNSLSYSFILYIFNVFGFFWLSWFVSALAQMVLAQVFAQWYWTKKKRDLPLFALTAAFYRTIRYHLGTLAFGSVIIAIIETIKFFIKTLLKTKRLSYLRIFYCICKCCCCCFNLLPKFITKNAYIMCAIHGKNFCRSAKDAFMLLMRNIVGVFVLDKVTSFVFFISEILVTAGVGAVAYLLFATDLIMNNHDLKVNWVPVIATMIVTFFISVLFFSVYSVAIDTLFLCFLEDCERNNGKDKPYYMSRDLMKIFMKKSKDPKYE